MYVESQQLLEANLEAQRRVLGPAHPDTIHTARWLDKVREVLFTEQPPRGAQQGGLRRGSAAARRHSRASAGHRHQARAQRPTRLGAGFPTTQSAASVALDDDETTWSLLAEYVTRAGCAALGCESEEAGSVCARCQAVRYCSSECQRLDLRAHKSACEEAVAAAAAS